MNSPGKYSEVIDRFARIGIWIIIAIGIVLRLILFFENRNLIVDEANIARNLFERDFITLILPLRYEQYAPPVFLWIEKFFSLTFGLGEKSLKLYPLICGIAALFVFHRVMKLLVPEPPIWLGLALLAFSPYLVEYSATVKQYMPDALITLLLVLLTLKKDLFDTPRLRFFLYWSIAGIIAICSSMPSVFVLAGVGLYYLIQCLQQRKKSYIWVLVLVAAVWLGAFSVYYFTILKPQIESDYLQSYHADYFIYALPANKAQWYHNYISVKEFIMNATGRHMFNLVCSCLLMATAAMVLIRKRPEVLALLLLPILLTFTAAALHQFSLIMRLVLFLMPLVVMLVTIGFAHYWQMPWRPARLVLVCSGLLMIAGYNRFKLFIYRYGFYEITEGLDYVRSKGGTGDRLYIHDASVPAYIYYTELHPDHENYSSLYGAHRLNWDTDYSQLTKDITDTCYFLYAGGFPEAERQKRTSQIEKNMLQVGYFRKNDWYVDVYTYVPRR